MAEVKHLARDKFIKKQLEIPIETLEPNSYEVTYPKATILDAAEVQRLHFVGQRRMVHAGVQEWNFTEVYDVPIINDILDGHVHLVKYGDQVVGTFRLAEGPEEDYETLDEGEWTDPEAPYLTVSRISAERVWTQCRSVGRAVMIYVRFVSCMRKINHIRVHVGEKNTAMIRRLELSNYRRVGTLTLKDGRKRIAFEKVYPPQQYHCPPRDPLLLP